MKAIMSKVNSNLKSILDVLEKDVKKLEKTMNATKNGDKQVKIKKNLILRKALLRYYKDKFNDVINNAERELSNYISIVDDTAFAERVFDLKNNELVNIQELLSDVTDDNLKEDIMDTYSQFAGSVVEERLVGSEIPEFSPSSTVTEGPVELNEKDETDENDYYGSFGSYVGEQISEEVEMKITDEDGNELYGSDVEESHGSNVEGKLVEDDEDEEDHGSNVEGKLVAEDEDEEDHGSNVPGKMDASQVAGKLVEDDEDEEDHGSNVEGKLVAEDEDEEDHSSDVEGKIDASQVAGKLVVDEDDEESSYGSNVPEDERKKLFPGSTVPGKTEGSKIAGKIVEDDEDEEDHGSNVAGKMSSKESK